MTDRVAFSAHHRGLLQLEREAEVVENERLLQQCSDAELVARGAALLRLQVADLEPGFGGRLHATLRPTRGGELPQHRFGPGDVVAMRSARDDDARVVGVLVRVRRDGVVVALEDDDDLPAVVRIDKVTTDVTFRRLDAALRALGGDADRDRARFLDLLFGEREEETSTPVDAEPWFDESLDSSQREAVSFALKAPRLARIHGPPGTGKTTALVELCRQAVAAGERLLACAPSNVAVDNLTERLASAGLRVVRLGHPVARRPHQCR